MKQGKKRGGSSFQLIAPSMRRYLIEFVNKPAVQALILFSPPLCFRPQPVLDVGIYSAGKAVAVSLCLRLKQCVWPADILSLIYM